MPPLASKKRFLNAPLGRREVAGKPEKAARCGDEGHGVRALPGSSGRYFRFRLGAFCREVWQQKFITQTRRQVALARRRCPQRRLLRGENCFISSHICTGVFINQPPSLESGSRRREKVAGGDAQPAQPAILSTAAVLRSRPDTRASPPPAAQRRLGARGELGGRGPRLLRGRGDARTPRSAAAPGPRAACLPGAARTRAGPGRWGCHGSGSIPDRHLLPEPTRSARAAGGANGALILAAATRGAGRGRPP